MAISNCKNIAYTRVKDIGSSKANNMRHLLIGIILNFILVGSLFANPVKLEHSTASLQLELNNDQPQNSAWVLLKLDLNPKWYAFPQFRKQVEQQKAQSAEAPEANVATTSKKKRRLRNAAAQDG